MRWPPWLLKIRIEDEENAFPIWLPLFIIGPIVLLLLLAIFLIMLPFALLAMILTWEMGWWRTFFLFFPYLFRLLGQLPGLTVDVGGQNKRVYVAFI